MESPPVNHTWGVAAAALLVLGAPRPVAGQVHHTTAPPVMTSSAWLSGGRAGHNIFAWNYDSVPIVITNMRISNCVNIQIPCRDSIPGVSVIAPKEVVRVATILAAEPTRPFSYDFSVDWRVATECSGVAHRVPVDAMTNGVSPPQLISFSLLPGAYAGKWPGSFPVMFYVTADGTADSIQLPGMAADGYGDVLRRVFKSYTFRPARQDGCPVPSFTEIRIQVANDLPKPSAYEGFAPTASELSRDTRGPRNPTSPREPYIVHGACPFECCRFGEWQANTTTLVYATEENVRGPLFALHRGDSVRATTGNVHTSHVGRVRIVGKLTNDWATFDDHRLPIPAIGDAVYVLSYDGEGVWRYWYRGLVGSGEGMWSEGPDSINTPGRMLVRPVSQWWVHIIDRRGRSGWVIVPRAGFGGYDSCG